MISTTVIEHFQGLESVAAEWDSLAVQAGRPYCAPGWLIPWWQHAAPQQSLLRLVVARRGKEVVGVAPFFTNARGNYRVLANGCSPRVEPLVRPGYEHLVHSAFSLSFGRCEPRPRSLDFHGLPEDSHWPEVFGHTFRHPAVIRHGEQPAPVIGLAPGGFDDWFASRSRNFRQSIRRSVRGLERAGARSRILQGGEARPALDGFIRLHHERWRARGGSGVLRPGVERMLAAVLEEMRRDRGFLATIAVADEIISAHLFLVAGGEVSYWLGGFDERWGNYQPALISLVDAVRWAFETKADRFDFNAGGQPYKFRFTSNAETLQWTTALPMGPRALTVRSRTVARHCMQTAYTALPEGGRRAVKRGAMLAQNALPNRRA